MRQEKLNEIIRFFIAGSLSFLVDFGLLFIFTESLHINYLYSSAISFTVSLIFNYWLCIKFVFAKVKNQKGTQVILFMGSSIVGLGINQVCMWVFVEKIGLFYMFAKIIATIIVTIWNYLMKRKAVNFEA